MLNSFLIFNAPAADNAVGFSSQGNLMSMRLMPSEILMAMGTCGPKRAQQKRDDPMDPPHPTTVPITGVTSNEGGAMAIVWAAQIVER